jgi:hypothetical protein
MAEHIHWKKTTNPNYLGAYAFDDGKDMIVQVKDVKMEMVQNQQGREEKNVMYFEGNIKPLILNSTNMKAIEKATGTAYLDEWVGKKLQLYVTLVSAFGTTTDAVRVREFAPRS